MSESEKRGSTTRTRILSRGPGHTVRLIAFSTALALSAFAFGMLSLVLAFSIHQGALFCGAWQSCSGAEPYLAVIPFAGAIRAAFLLRRRPWVKRRMHGYFEEVGEAISDAALGSLVLIVFTFFFRSGSQFRTYSYSRLIFVYDWLIASALLVLLAVVVKATLEWLRRSGHNEKSVVVIRAEGETRAITEFIQRCPEMGYKLLSTIVVSKELTEEDQALLQSELLAVAEATPVDEVILAVPTLNRETLSNLVGVADLVNLELKAVPELFGLPPRKISIEKLGNLPLLSLLEEPLPGGRRVLKRVVDIVLATGALVVAAPLMLISALLTRLSSPGPVLLRQVRIGMDGRPFLLFKFRTMLADNDSSNHQEYVKNLIRGDVGEPTGADQALFKIEDDPRVTGVGSFLRKLSLDELPQLFNVLLGDMSLVGPRPPLPFEVSLYEEWHRRRLEVRPGMTGLWQVSGRSRLSFDDMVRLDIEYVERWSPVLDLMIIVKTIPALLKSETG